MERVFPEAEAVATDGFELPDEYVSVCVRGAAEMTVMISVLFMVAGTLAWFATFMGQRKPWLVEVPSTLME
jgi:hypothetical protein